MMPKMSQERLAELAGLNPETVRRIENQRDPAKFTGRMPRGEAFIVIATALECDASELLEWPTRVFSNGESPLLELIEGGGRGGPAQTISLF